MFALAVAVTSTIYVTLEIEYPRRGLMRLSDIDQTLFNLGKFYELKLYEFL
jgi:hypothetical protein